MMFRRGSALVQAVVISSILTGGAVVITALQLRSNQNLTRIQNRTIDRTTGEAATEHGVAIVKTAMDAGVALEDITEIAPNVNLNARDYALDLTLAPFGDVRAGMRTDRAEVTAARVDPNTGELMRAAAGGTNVDPLVLSNEWRTATIHDDAIIALHQNDVFIIRTNTQTMGLPTPVRFEDRNAPIASLHAFNDREGSSARPLGAALDRSGSVWVWNLSDAIPTAKRAVGTQDGSSTITLPPIQSLTTTEHALIGVDRNGAFWVFGFADGRTIIPEDSASSGSQTLRFITGTGELALRERAISIPTPVGATEPKFTRLLGGRDHVIALDEFDNIYGWGDNSLKQLPNSEATHGNAGGTHPCNNNKCRTARVNPNKHTTNGVGTSARHAAGRVTFIETRGNAGLTLDDRGNVTMWGNGEDPVMFDARDLGPGYRFDAAALGTEHALLRLNSGDMYFATLTADGIHVAPGNITFQPSAGSTTNVRNPDLIRVGANAGAIISAGRLFAFAPPTIDTNSSTVNVPTQHIASPRERNTGAPGSIRNVTITPRNQQLQITWEADSTTNGTNHTIATSIDGSNWTNAITTAATTATIPNLTNGLPYYVRIQPTNDTNTTWTGGPHTPHTTPDAIDPSTITQTATGTTLLITWTPPNNNGSPIIHYRIEQQTTTNPTWEPLPTPTTTNSIRGNALSTDGTSVRIIPVNAAGDGPPTEFNLSDRPPEPVNIEIISGHRIGEKNHGITVHWSHPNPTNVTKYLIETSTDGQEWASEPSVTGGSDPTYQATIGNLDLRKNYAVRITPQNVIGTGPHRIQTATVTEAPAAPTNVTATRDGDTITLRWDRATDGNTFVIHRYHAGILTEYTTTGTTFKDPSTQPGFTYRYRVAHAQINATNSTVGQFSAPAQANTRVTKPTAVRNLRADNLTPNSATIRWAPPEFDGGAPLKYDISVNGNTAFEVNTTVHTIENLTELTTYEVTITPRNTSGNATNTGTSTTITFTTPSATLSPVWTITATNEQHGVVNLRFAPPTVDDERIQMSSIKLIRTTITSNGVPSVTTSFNIATDTMDYVDATGTIGESYAYQLTGVTKTGVTITSSTTAEIKPLLGVPEAPTNLSITPIVSGARAGFRMSWTAADDRGGDETVEYVITRMQADGETDTGIKVNTPYAEDADTTLQISQTYQYVIRTHNDRFQSAPEYFPSTTLTPLPKPPANFTATYTRTTNTVTLSWSPPTFIGDGTTQYVITRTSSPTTQITLPNTTFTWTDNTNITANSTIEYSILTRTTKNDIPTDSANIDAKVTIPLTITLDAPTPTYNQTTGSIQVNWINQVANAAYYGVFATVHTNKTCEGEGVLLSTRPGTPAAYQVGASTPAALIAGNTYCFRVTANDDKSNLLASSGYGAPIPAIMRPQQPTDDSFTVTAVNAGRFVRAKISGNVPTPPTGQPVTHVIIQRKKTTDTTWNILSGRVDIQNGAWEYIDTSVTVGNDVSYQIAYRNDMGPGSFSDAKQIVLSATNAGEGLKIHSVARDATSGNIDVTIETDQVGVQHALNFETFIGSVPVVANRIWFTPGSTLVTVPINTVSSAYWRLEIEVTNGIRTAKFTVDGLVTPSIEYEDELSQPSGGITMTSVNPKVNGSTNGFGNIGVFRLAAGTSNKFSINEITGEITRSGNKQEALTPTCLYVSLMDPVRTDIPVVSNIPVRLTSHSCTPQ